MLAFRNCLVRPGQGPRLGEIVESTQAAPYGLGARLAVAFASQKATQSCNHSHRLAQRGRIRGQRSMRMELRVQDFPLRLLQDGRCKKSPASASSAASATKTRLRHNGIRGNRAAYGVRLLQLQALDAAAVLEHLVKLLDSPAIGVPLHVTQPPSSTERMGRVVANIQRDGPHPTRRVDFLDQQELKPSHRRGPRTVTRGVDTPGKSSEPSRLCLSAGGRFPVLGSVISTTLATGVCSKAASRYFAACSTRRFSRLTRISKSTFAARGAANNGKKSLSRSPITTT